jgi:hypothetical protein
MSVELFVVTVTAVLTILLVAAWAYSRRQRSADQKRSERLREQFGPEYERTVAETGSTHKAEIELTARQKRVAGLDIRHLTTAQGKAFADEWLHVQADFVDDPSSAVRDADALVGKVMAARGYPVTDFEQRSADMSVDHAQVLSHYRAAHEIALRDARGEANTEDLRQAVISSRMLFDELVERSATVQKIERSETLPAAVEPTTPTAVPVMAPASATPEAVTEPTAQTATPVVPAVEPATEPEVLVPVA